MEYEEFSLDYKSLDDLSYFNNEDYIELYHKDIFVCNIFVYLDSEQDYREYIIINYELVYLDTITLN